MSLTYPEVVTRLSHLGQLRGEWAGIPMPIQGLRLTVEDRNPYAKGLAELQDDLDAKDKPALEDDEWQYVNTWWSRRWRMTVGIARNTVTGEYTTTQTRFDYVKKVEILIETLRAAKDAWVFDAEVKAMETLGTHLAARPHLFETYITTGTFLETSRRSGLTYIFRRCRPTLVYNSERQRMLCALCLHPIGYYQDSHAGSLVPTDDVIAHLLLMRADEPLLWRRANQHPVDRPEAGL